MARATARIAAMQLIFEQMAGGEGGDDTLQMVYDELRSEKDVNVKEDEPGVSDRAWISTVLEGVLNHVDDLDEKINGASRGWTVERMPWVDLTILRLGAWELLYEQGVPGPVIVNEAVELAKKYSEPAAGRFINGVLGTILREKETDGKAAEASAEGSPMEDAPTEEETP